MPGQGFAYATEDVVLMYWQLSSRKMLFSSHKNTISSNNSKERENH